MQPVAAPMVVAADYSSFAANGQPDQAIWSI